MTTLQPTRTLTASPLYHASQGKPLQKPQAQFSAASDAATSTPWNPLVAKLYRPNIQFGARPLYHGPFENIKILTDYGVGKTESISNLEVKDRFHKVLDFVQSAFNRPRIRQQFAFEPWTQTPTGPAGTLDVDSESDIFGGNKDYIGLGLVRLGAQAPNKNIYIHVIDPGVGVSGTDHDRSILVTEDYGIYVGPNNGSLGLLARRLEALGETPKLYQIDFTKVEALERIRLEAEFQNLLNQKQALSEKTGIAPERKALLEKKITALQSQLAQAPKYEIPETIHGRDVFAVVAAAIAGGLTPESFALRQADGTIKTLPVVETPFSGFSKLPTRAGEVTEVLALRDKTFSNLKLNVQLSDTEFNTLLTGEKRFEVLNPKTHQWVTIPVKKRFSDVPLGDLLLYHGSSPALEPGTRRLELASNLNHAGEIFGIGTQSSQPLKFRLASH